MLRADQLKSDTNIKRNRDFRRDPCVLRHVNCPEISATNTNWNLGELHEL